MMKRKYSLISMILIITMLLVGCVGANPPAETDSDTEEVTGTAEETTSEATKHTDTTETASEIVSETETEEETIPPEDACHLVTDGKSEYTIVIGKNAAEAEAHAASELQEYLAAITGATLPIKRDSEVTASEKEIVVGVTDRADAEKFEMEDGYRIHFEGQTLYIAGGSPRGTLYGVYGFLEMLGCRFFTAEVETVPKTETIILNKKTDHAEQPAFVYRDLFWSSVYDEDISAKLRINGSVKSGENGRTLSDKVGGGIDYAGPHFVHTFAYMMTKETHFATHPEYFSEIDGKRTAEFLYSQLCMTNPDVLALVIRHVTGWLRSNPDAKLVSVSQNDSYVDNSYCTCKSCQAIIDEEGSPAGPLLRFVNAVAEAIEKEFPDVYVDTLAYQYSLTPPKLTKARDNVVVRFCTWGCMVHPLTECEENKELKQVILAWKEVCPRLYVWDYTTNFHHYIATNPNFERIRGNAQFFYENNVIGVFSQGLYHADSKSGEFGELRAYLQAKLLWDPYADTEALTREFLEAYYGAAAPYIEEYISYTQELFGEMHLSINFSPTELAPCLNESAIAHLNAQWEGAKKAVADDKTLLDRVERSELQYRYIQKVSGTGEYDTDKQNKIQKLTLIFDEDRMDLGVDRLNEAGNVQLP